MSQTNIGKQLTAELILAKTKSNNLQSIKNLNLWGNQLEDLSILQKMPNLEVISLSVNKISSLKDFRHCIKLQELYLRKNCISDIREIKYIMKLPTLKVLWLHDNPCALIENYRQFVIKHLPNLQKLDNNPVSPAQVSASKNIKITIKSYDQQEQKSQIKRQKAQISAKQTSMQYKQQKVQSKHRKQVKQDYTQQMNRNKNILMAVLSLMKQLDLNSLQIVKRQSQNLINNNY